LVSSFYFGNLQELILALKIQFLNFISNLKPHFDFLTSKTSEAYHVSIDTLTTIVENLQSLSINTLVTIVENLQRSATQFIKVQKKTLIYLILINLHIIHKLAANICFTGIIQICFTIYHENEYVVAFRTYEGN
jgi:hypothetical protein